MKGWTLCPALPSLHRHSLLIVISLDTTSWPICHHTSTEVGTVYGHLDQYIQSLTGEGERQSIKAVSYTVVTPGCH